MNSIAGKLLFTVAILVISFGAAADDAGSVLFVKGDVSAERAPPVALTKGDTILSDDLVVTGASSRAQLLMLDGAKIAMRPDSRLRIDEYSYTPAPSGTAVSASTDKSVMSLVKGGFRTITGAIGKDDEEDYEVRTAVGVLGIRGTDYTAVFCNGDCTWVPGLPASAPIADGLYLGVNGGVIVFRTATRTIELKAGEFAFIPLDDPQPQRLDEAPPVLLDENEFRFDAANQPGRDSEAPGASGFNTAIGTRRAPDSSAPGQDGSDSKPGDDGSDSSSAPQQPTIGVDQDGNPIDLTPGNTPPPPQRQPSTIAYGGGPLGGAQIPFTGAGDNDPAQVPIDANGDILGFEVDIVDRSGNADTLVFDIGSAANVGTGSDSMTMMRWGRWDSGAASVTTVSSGNTTNIDLGAENIHWIQSAEGTPPVMPITGTANYTLIGATSPTDNLGNVGVLGDATFNADFTNMIVNSSLTIDINSSTWTATGSGNIGAQVGLPAHLFQGFYNNVSIDGIGGGSGAFSGFFSEPGPTSDPTLPGGAGLTYSLQDAQGGTTVSGAAAFGNP